MFTGSRQAAYLKSPRTDEQSAPRMKTPEAFTHEQVRELEHTALEQLAVNREVDALREAA